MKQRTRIYYSDSQKALMWERWKKGESLQQIAQLFDRNHSSISRILAETGGIRPAQRCRSQFALSLAEREEILRALAAGRSIRSIASQLGRLHQPSAVRSSATVARAATARPRPTRLPGIGHFGPRLANWWRSENWPTLWLVSFNCNGHHSKSLGG